MQQKLIIKGRLAGRNEAEKAARSHWSVGARLKADSTELVMWEAISQHIKPLQAKAHISLTFYEKDFKRDADNVIAGTKYILDGLVAAKIIKNDTRKCVELNILPVKVDKANPRIEVVIEDVEELAHPCLSVLR